MLEKLKSGENNFSRANNENTPKRSTKGMSVLDKIKLGQKVRVTGGLLTAVSSNKG